MKCYCRNTGIRYFVILLSFFVLFLLSAFTAEAAVKAPSKVTLQSVKALSKTSVQIKWKKLKKNVSGYAIYRDGKLIKRVSAKTVSFKDTGLKSGKTYSYKVRAYKTYKATEWYNKKTQKWQEKKPAATYRGKKRKVNKYKYGGYSAVKKIKTKTKKASNTTGASTMEWQQEMLDKVNAERKKHGASPLTLDPRLCETAQEKAEDMYKNRKMSHYSNTLGGISNQLAKRKISYHAWGENVAFGQSDVSTVMTAWNNSKGHHDNIVNKNYTAVGFGYCNGYWAQQFIG